jgi:spore cortex formation protein SpoVR/YcgB (stage V sporulation)
MTEPLLITSHTDWTQDLIERVYKEIEKIAYEELELEGLVYPNQLEIITAEQMIDAYASIGLPVHYNHWSFGKDFLRTQQAYEKGRQGLAYEIVINSSPCISYLMEVNSMMMQALVIAHAAFGHNAVFKNNECFKQWTNAGSIVDYMSFARDYIRKCEDRYGPEAVEMVLDAAHALAPHGVDKFKRKHKPKLNEELRLKKLIDDENRQQAELDIVLKKTSFRDTEIEDAEVDDTEDEENLLYFIMKKSPNLEQWKREIIRIVYKINQYFYPQGQTQNLNEGFASFTHYYIMTRLEEKGILSSDAFIAFLDSHAGVLYQPEYNKRWYSGINPYALGFNILMDVKRICEKPTEEDRDWFPHLIGKRWQDAIKEAVFEHRDDSFIMQYLSPNVIRKMGLFSVNVTEDLENFEGQKAVVSDIHDEAGYKQIRINLARSYERINRVPQIAVTGADLEGDRTLYLEYIPYMGRKLDRETAESVADYIDFLWGYPVELDDGEPDED